MGPRVREDGSGDSQRDGGSLRGKFCLRRKSCRRGKLEGAEEVSCAGENASAMAIASVGVRI